MKVTKALNYKLMHEERGVRGGVSILLPVLCSGLEMANTQSDTNQNAREWEDVYIILSVQ